MDNPKTSPAMSCNVVPLIIHGDMSPEEEARFALLGDFANYLLDNGLVDRQWFYQELDKSLTNNADRLLFDLPAIPYRS
jgi:hypothetical protein